MKRIISFTGFIVLRKSEDEVLTIKCHFFNVENLVLIFPCLTLKEVKA